MMINYQGIKTEDTAKILRGYANKQHGEHMITLEQRNLGFDIISEIGEVRGKEEKLESIRNKSLPHFYNLVSSLSACDNPDSAYMYNIKLDKPSIKFNPVDFCNINDLIAALEQYRDCTFTPEVIEEKIKHYCDCDLCKAEHETIVRKLVINIGENRITQQREWEQKKAAKLVELNNQIKTLNDEAAKLEAELQ
jgi:hypothetical protein